MRLCVAMHGWTHRQNRITRVGTIWLESAGWISIDRLAKLGRWVRRSWEQKSVSYVHACTALDSKHLQRQGTILGCFVRVSVYPRRRKCASENSRKYRGEWWRRVTRDVTGWLGRARSKHLKWAFSWPAMTRDKVDNQTGRSWRKKFLKRECAECKAKHK